MAQIFKFPVNKYQESGLGKILYLKSLMQGHITRLLELKKQLENETQVVDKSAKPKLKLVKNEPEGTNKSI